MRESEVARGVVLGFKVQVRWYFLDRENVRENGGRESTVDAYDSGGASGRVRLATGDWRLWGMTRARTRAKVR